MKQYSYFKAIWMSFYSKELYLDIKNNKKGTGIPYLAGLVFFFTMIFVITVFYLVNFNVEKKSERITEILFEDAELPFETNLNRILNMMSLIPEAKLIGNKLNINADSVVSVKDSYSKRNFAIFDPDGEIKTLKDSDAVLLFSKNYIIQKYNNNRENLIYFSKLNSYSQKFSTAFNFAAQILSQIPKMKLLNGRLVSNIKEPRLIKYNYNGNEYIPGIIDPTGVYDDISAEETFPFILITKNKLIMRSIFDKTNISEIYLSDIDINIAFKAIKYVVKIYKNLLLIAIPVIFTMIFLTALVSVLCFVCLVAVIGNFIISYNKFKPVDFLTLFRISCVASTPTLILNFIFPMMFFSQKILYLLIAAFYIYYAIKSCEKYEETL